ncbi:MAG TPA: helix-turn-helix domain-containing protein [Candidatus Nanoarchaeia archaeon]|nr:helix-turn-helix domain-containing protein [Candidatus Nanoarchaeia archaeon]
MNEQFLQDIGLTPGEVRIYLALLSLGQTSSGPIIKESGISSSKVYEILDKLMQKGLASVIIKNKVKYFQATSPAKLRNYLADKSVRLEKEQQQLEKYMPSLLAAFGQKQVAQDAQFFSGKSAIKTMLWDLISDAKPAEDYLFFGGTGEQYAEALQSVYSAYDKLRTEKKLSVRGIISHTQRKSVPKGYHAPVRYVTFPTPSNIGIFRDKVAIQSWTEPPIAILITSANIAQQMRDFFESAWDSAKK